MSGLADQGSAAAGDAVDEIVLNHKDRLRRIVGSALVLPQGDGRERRCVRIMHFCSPEKGVCFRGPEVAFGFLASETRRRTWI